METLKILISLLTLWAALLGCATRQEFNNLIIPDSELDVHLYDKPDQMKPAYKKMLEEGDRNAVLNQMQIGLDAYQLGFKKLGVEAFDNALSGIGRVFANNETAIKARSLWYEEGMKTFKGEPYERAMAYYYRGIGYLEDRDYENARAAFKSGIIQDAFAEEDQMRCDFALLIFLEGWASEMAGDHGMAEEAYKEVMRLRPDFEAFPGRNFLLLVETGKSPRKVADGPGHAELKYRRGKDFIDKKTEISIDGSGFIDLYPIEDIFFQASSRGGRPIDKINQGKVVFKQNNENLGVGLTDAANVAMLGAPLFENAGQIQAASAALGLFGVAEIALAARLRPHADTRYWNNLPDIVHVYTAKLPAGDHRVRIQFKDQTGNVISGIEEKEIRFKIEDNKPVFLWLRSRDQLSSTANLSEAK